MSLRNKNILLISPEPWDHIFVSKHHYAVHLERRGNRVFFLGPPGDSETLETTGYENVTVVSYRGFPRGLRFFPGMVQRYFIIKVYKKLEELCLARFDVIWSFDNSVFFDFTALPETVLKISHIVDLNQDFQTRKAAATANVCFCTTDLILKRLLAYNQRSFKINHGFNDSVLPGKPVLLPGKATVKALYSGNLAMPYIDWDVICVAVRDHPEIDFIFIGPDYLSGPLKNPAKQEVERSANAFFVGRVGSSELLGYYRAADILLVAYQEKYRLDQANPHKMMEYLGSGKMIVTTFTAEYKDLSEQDLFLMSETNDQFAHLLSKAMNELECWNNSQNQQLRKNIALDNTYGMQIERIENYISSFRID